MNDLTAEQVITFHEQLIKTDGGDDRLLSESSLHQMIFSANGIDDVHQRAAFTFFTLVAYPVFREGNSRTAQRVAETILNDNGYTLDEVDDEMTGLAQGITLFTVEQADIEEWLRSHYKKDQTRDLFLKVLLQTGVMMWIEEKSKLCRGLLL